MVYHETEETKRLIRAGYYQKTGKPLDEKTFSELALHDKKIYQAHAKKRKKREDTFKVFGYGLLAIFIIGFWSYASVQPSSNDTNKKSTSENTTTTQTPEAATSSNYTIPEEEPAYLYEEEPIEDDCNPNYSGCVENSSYDLDCSDIGSEVEVLDYDEYGLDRDGDGYGCESY